MDDKKTRPMRRSVLTLAVAAILCGALPTPAEATVMVYADVELLTELSDRVVRGIVRDARTFEGEDGQITTEWTIEVRETLLGQHADQVVVRQWGGTLDGVTMHVPGDAWFELGEHVLVFLRGDSPARSYLTAMGQSVFRVQMPIGGTPSAELVRRVERFLPGTLQEPAATPDPFLVRDLSDIAFYDMQGEDNRIFEIGLPEMMTLPAMRREIERANDLGEADEQEETR